MTETTKTPQCWACGNDLKSIDQKACQNCDRWQKLPWKYITISNSAVAVIAAIISTGVAIMAVRSDYIEKSNFNYIFAGRSIIEASGNLGIRVQNYSKNSFTTADSASCVLLGNKNQTYDLKLPDRWRFFPAAMSSEVSDRYFVPDGQVTLAKGEVYKCTIELENINGFKSLAKFTAEVY